jgi:twinkle protein
MFLSTQEAHLPCPDCGSSDGLTRYDDHTFCFVCEKWTPCAPLKGRKEQPMARGLIPMDDMETKALTARGIRADTCRKYKYTVTRNKDGSALQVANYCDRDGNIIFQKTRDKDKNFSVLGHKQDVFYGQHLFHGGRKLVVTEGEIDCLTVSQVQDNKYPVVSIPFGCQTAAKIFKEQLDWLNKFDEVIVFLDEDEAGRRALKKLGGILPPGKFKIAHLPMKDPNECLLAGHPEHIVHAIWNAEEYRPDGILNAKDLKEKLLEDKEIESYSFPWGYHSKLNRMTGGIRKGEMLLLTAGSGIGKSTMARELAYFLHGSDALKVGLVMLEESPKKTLRDLMSIHLAKPLHLNWNEKTREEVRAHYDEVFGDGGILLYDHFGSMEADNLLDKIRYLIVAAGCDFVILDHITIAVTAMDDRKLDERSTIDRLMTTLRSLVEETGAGLIIVSHLRKTDTKTRPFEQGGSISMDDLRGSGSLKQLPDTILAIERDQQADSEQDKNTLKIRVLKCRFTGTTGLADSLRFDKAKNKLELYTAEGGNAPCQF